MQQAYPNSPFYWFDRNSPGWLFNKVCRQKHIDKIEIARVLEADDAALRDPRMAPIIIASINDKLAVKKGRSNHKDSFNYFGRIFWAKEFVEDRAEKIRKEQKNMYAIEKRALPIPTEQAAEEIAREYNMPESGHGLLKAI